MFPHRALMFHSFTFFVIMITIATDCHVFYSQTDSAHCLYFLYYFTLEQRFKPKPIFAHNKVGILRLAHSKEST